MIAYDTYYEIRHLPAFYIGGAIRKYRNKTSRTYVFNDKSRLTIIAGGSAKVRDENGMCVVHGAIQANKFEYEVMAHTETVKPDSLLTVNVMWSGLVKCKLLWVRGDVATVKVTERKNPDFKLGDTIDCPTFRLSSRKGWFKSRQRIGRMFYAGATLNFDNSCFVK